MFLYGGGGLLRVEHLNVLVVKALHTLISPVGVSDDVLIALTHHIPTHPTEGTIHEALTMLGRCNNAFRYQARRRRMPAMGVRDGMGRGVDRWGESNDYDGDDDGDLAGDGADDRALEDGYGYEADHVVVVVVHADVLSLAYAASNARVQLLNELSEYNPVVYHVFRMLMRGQWFLPSVIDTS